MITDTDFRRLTDAAPGTCREVQDHLPYRQATELREACGAAIQALGLVGVIEVDVVGPIKDRHPSEAYAVTVTRIGAQQT